MLFINLAVGIVLVVSLALNFIMLRNIHRINKAISEFGKERPRANYIDEKLIFQTRADAEKILGILKDEIFKFRFVTVEDLFALLEEDSLYTDSNYGWTNLNDAKILMVEEGYQLVLPRAKKIDI